MTGVRGFEYVSVINCSERLCLIMLMNVCWRTHRWTVATHQFNEGCLNGDRPTYHEEVQISQEDRHSYSTRLMGGRGVRTSCAMNLGRMNKEENGGAELSIA